MRMAPISPHDRPLLRIAKVAGRYLLFDIDDVMYVRRHYNICSVFVGTLPQNPEQNILMGLPLELMPEEAQVLVERKVAYIADDTAFHPSRLAAFDESSRRAYLRLLKNQGKKLQIAAIENSNRHKPLRYRGKPKKTKGKDTKDSEGPYVSDIPNGNAGADESTSLFDSAPIPHKNTETSPVEVEGYALTPTTSSFLLLPDSGPEPSACVDVPASYPLFAHLHDKGYYMMPGLRFGCDYNVYPGDPLRFHSHFAGVHFGWEEEITMLDLVGGGRLATSVKKGYLFGGAITDNAGTKQARDSDRVLQDNSDGLSKTDGGQVAPPVRAFCLEWAGM